MDTHLVFYVDMLGVRSLIKSQDIVRIEGLQNLLHDIALLRGPFELIDDRTDPIITRPEISTFSDHIVISYRIGGEGLVTDIVSGAFAAGRLIAELAATAFPLGLMIRGGATLGQLHHRDGVVLGEALVEAYELESQLANYPRVLLSKSLYSQLKEGMDWDFLLTDLDGLPHLNYFRWFCTYGEENGKIFVRWLDEVLTPVTENIQKLEAARSVKEVAKWVWFKNTVDQFISVAEKLFQGVSLVPGQKLAMRRHSKPRNER